MTVDYFSWPNVHKQMCWLLGSILLLFASQAVSIPNKLQLSIMLIKIKHDRNILCQVTNDTELSGTIIGRSAKSMKV